MNFYFEPHTFLKNHNVATVKNVRNHNRKSQQKLLGFFAILTKKLTQFKIIVISLIFEIQIQIYI